MCQQRPDMSPGYDHDKTVTQNSEQVSIKEKQSWRKGVHG